MSNISVKTGECIDCGPGSLPKPLTAGRCHQHYWRYRNQLSADKQAQRALNSPATDNGKLSKFDKQQALDKWFAQQISIMPRHCENCSEYLNPYLPWGAKAYIAHIVAKRNFESVMCHPLNRAFLCVICHTNFDNWPEEEVILMPVFEVIVERFMIITPSIAFEELKHLPEYFVKLLN